MRSAEKPTVGLTIPQNIAVFYVNSTGGWTNVVIMLILGRSILFAYFANILRADCFNQIKARNESRDRRVIDLLYDEYVGIHLKSKKFIDQMGQWQDVLKPKINDRVGEISMELSRLFLNNAVK